MGENKQHVFPAWDISILSKSKLSKNQGHHSNIMVVFGFLALFALCLPFVLSSPTFASTYSISMSTSGTVNVDVSVSGTGASIAEDELTVVSTCPLGYTVSISGPNDRTLYRNGNSSNNTTEQTITASTGTTSNPASILGNNLGTWGYALGDNITTSSSFIGLASTASTLITKNTASATGGDTVSVYYGVSVHPNQVPGLYTMAESQVGAGDNVITYFITTPQGCSSYVVNFNPTSTAGGTTLSGTSTMNSQTISEGIATTLTPNSFIAPEGYSFWKWNTSQDGTGTSYTDEQNVTDLVSANSSITLYAQWILNMQDATFEDCGKLMMDKRDRNIYTTAKIGGMCYMTKNLDLAGGTTLTPELSNVTSSYTLPVSSLSGFSDYDGEYVYNSGNTSCGENSPCYSYYSYRAAIAGSAINSNNAAGDICPKNWRLPTKGEYDILAANYTTGASLNNGPFLGAYSGSIVNGSFVIEAANNDGISAAYWSSTIYSASSAYKLRVVNASTSTSFNSNYAGFPVRCVTKATIQYNENGANSPTTMGEQVIDSSDSEIILWASNFKRSGYGFAGWNTKADGTGTKYGPNETIDDANTLDDIKKNGLTLYAMWVQSAGNLQGWTCPDNTTMPIGTVTALTDTRDNDTYAIAKLADGKCWMIENLRLDNTATINDSNTNHPASGFALSASTDPGVAAWCATTASSCLDQSMISTAHTTNTVSKMTANDQNIYSYGNYYNWYSATAGNGTSSSTILNDSIDGSICPAGWHLPTGGSDSNSENSDYWDMVVSAVGTLPNSLIDTGISQYVDSNGGNQGETASDAIRSYPYNFLFTGGITNSTIGRHGYGGVYWASTIRSAQNAYYLDLWARSVGYRTMPGNGHNAKYWGFPIRCVKSPIQNNMYMQDVTTYNVNDTEENVQYTLKDRRDEKTYTVAKINGALWMTQNLRITGTISAAESNFTGADFNTCVSDLTTGTSTDEARCHNSNNTTNGVWYNYASTTAGTITGTSTNDATEDICPAGWSLPYHDANASPGSAESILGAVTQFSPVIGGQYDSNLRDTTEGYWWTSSNNPNADRYILQYNANINLIVYDAGGYRTFGRYIRCVHK